MPEGAVYVGRPSLYGNPFRAGQRFYVSGRIGAAEWYDNTPHGCVKAFDEWIHEHPDYWAPLIAQLRGKDLACWCPLGQPCHADVLLEIANP